MTVREMILTDAPHLTRAADVVELHLLVPSDHITALEAAATRSHLTVAALVRRVLGDFLLSPAAVGFVGEVAGRPTAPLLIPGEVR
jgi:hypothetical protein